MNISQSINRTIRILFSPKKEWRMIKDERSSSRRLILFYFLPFIIISILAHIIGISVLRYDLGLKSSILPSLVFGAGIPLITFFMSSYAFNRIIMIYCSETDDNLNTVLIIYSFTPLLISTIFSGIFYTYQIGSFILTGGLYGIYILWYGINVLLKIPKEKIVTVFTLTSTSLILIYLIFFWCITLIFNIISLINFFE